MFSAVWMNSLEQADRAEERKQINIVFTSSSQTEKTIKNQSKAQLWFYSNLIQLSLLHFLNRFL